MSAVDSVRPAWRHAPLLMGIIALAWGLAIGAELTGQAQWVHHHRLVVDGMAVWFSLGLFLVAWQVHVAAMMLPTTLPMVGLYRQVAAGQAHPRLARLSFLAGYLVVWTAFGVAALVATALLEGLSAHWHWLHQRPEWLAGGTLVLAGAFQFSALKARCLDKCRQPRAFLLNHYRQGLAGGLVLGVRHGAFCLGCCWALMLVMFAVGIANLAWMAPLAALMLYEKVGRHGARLVRPVGGALILLGLLVAAGPAWLPSLVPDHGLHPGHMHGSH
jgi:predicted metal-binding membrane protein